jgi:hypothetical protein
VGQANAIVPHPPSQAIGVRTTTAPTAIQRTTAPRAPLPAQGSQLAAWHAADTVFAGAECLAAGFVFAISTTEELIAVKAVRLWPE